jgi:hypothetical protein
MLERRKIAVIGAWLIRRALRDLRSVRSTFVSRRFRLNADFPITVDGQTKKAEERRGEWAMGLSDAPSMT